MAARPDPVLEIADIADIADIAMIDASAVEFIASVD
jgi:hypothetical protein